MDPESIGIGIGRSLSVEERANLTRQVKEFFAEELERDIADIRDEAHLINDLDLDSLIFLALFEELQAEYEVTVDTRKLAKLARTNPAETVGELIDFIARIIEGTVTFD